MKDAWWLGEEEGLLVLNKPPHVVSTGRRLDDPDCFQGRVMAALGRKVWFLHQLDAPTSGLMLATTRASLVAPWQERLRAPRGVKTYIAFCHGRAPRRAFTVDAALAGQAEPDGWRVRVLPEGREARTDFWTLGELGDACVLAARLRTGRTHQIRAHLEHVGLQLWGERRYGPAPSDAHTRHALHAFSVGVRETVGGFSWWEAPCAPDLAALSEARWGCPATHWEALARATPWNRALRAEAG